MGRDVCLLSRLAERHMPDQEIRIVGVDKFSDTPCADWPEDRRQLGSWHAAGYGNAPSFGMAKNNVRMCASKTHAVELVCADDQQFLADVAERFEFVYIDTAHDYETVARQLRQVKHCVKGASIVVGDDYSDQGTWGVVRAVKDGTDKHFVFQKWNWITHRAWIR